MVILGINSAYHESAAALIVDGKILATVEEERFNRIKHAKQARTDNPNQLPELAIQYCLKSARLKPQDVDLVGFSLNPIKRLDNRNFEDFTEANGWGTVEGEQIFYDNLLNISQRMQQMGFSGELRWLDHHLCHAASAYYPSTFEEAAILVVDGIGEISSTSFASGQANRIHLLKEIQYPASLGFLWEKLSKFLGFSEYDAYKVMGLSAYGDPTRYRARFEQILRLDADGGFSINSQLLRFRIEDYQPLAEFFGFGQREASDEILQAHADLAAALQEATNQAMLHMARAICTMTQSPNLCMAGGVALNCIANRVAFEEGPFDQLYIQPAAHDAGTALGAAMLLWADELNVFRAQRLQGATPGPAFDDGQIEQALQQQPMRYHYCEHLEDRVAELLSQGYIVGWFQGEMEWGPRALGNRSLLADPRRPDMRTILNAKVKHREDFRPLAPSVLIEHVDQWFEVRKPTPASDYMLLVYPVKPGLAGQIPAVVHHDGTSRIQTVKRAANPRYHQLISKFYQLTGVPMVLNTSFNDSEPIVCTPEHALRTFLETEIDYLAIGNYLVEKHDRA